jgi:hypothetical protein
MEVKMSNDKYENRNEENADEGVYGLIFVILIALVLAQLLSVLNY